MHRELKNVLDILHAVVKDVVAQNNVVIPDKVNVAIDIVQSLVAQLASAGFGDVSKVAEDIKPVTDALDNKTST